MDIKSRDRLREAINQLLDQIPVEQVEQLEAKMVDIVDNYEITDQEATIAVMQIAYAAGASNYSGLVVHKRWAPDQSLDKNRCFN